jgi:uroporphyrinogen III methyltransferase/synthase
MIGKRILITRNKDQISTLSEQLREKGAEIVELPTIDIRPVSDLSEIHTAIGNLSQYQWIVFTSVNGVKYFFEQLEACGKDAQSLLSLKTAIVGRETAVALNKFGITADLLPDKFTSEGLAETFVARFPNMKGQKVLIPTSAIARDVLANELRKLGAAVDVIAIYTNELPEYPVEYLKNIFEKPFDLVVFTSSSTVTNLATILQKNNLSQILADLKGASIGSVTSNTIQDTGMYLALEAEEHTIQGLVKSIAAYFGKC